MCRSLDKTWFSCYTATHEAPECDSTSTSHCVYVHRLHVVLIVSKMNHYSKTYGWMSQQSYASGSVKSTEAFLFLESRTSKKIFRYTHLPGKEGLPRKSMVDRVGCLTAATTPKTSPPRRQNIARLHRKGLLDHLATLAAPMHCRPSYRFACYNQP